MKSGSSVLTTSVSFSNISVSAPVIGYSFLSPYLSTTAAAHSMVLSVMLVSRSKDMVTNGAGNGSALLKPLRSQDTTISRG